MDKKVNAFDIFTLAVLAGITAVVLICFLAGGGF